MARRNVLLFFLIVHVNPNTEEHCILRLQLHLLGLLLPQALDLRTSDSLKTPWVISSNALRCFTVLLDKR